MTPPYPSPVCALCDRAHHPGRPVRMLGAPEIPAHPGCFRAARRGGVWRRTRQRHGLTPHLRTRIRAEVAERGERR